MDISVIIPTYNRKQSLSKAIESVIQQSRPANEIIVIDDGSSDDSKSYISAKYPQIKYVYQSNQGVSAARNRGIEIARNPWLAFLDSDDWWHKNKLKSQASVIKQHPEYKVCHTNETWIRNGSHLNQKKIHKKRGGYIFKYCLPLCVISPSSILLHRDILDDIGMFDETLPACEDYELWLRLSASYPLAYVTQQLVNKNGGHADQLSKKYWGMDKFRIRAMEKLLINTQLTKEQTGQVREALRYKLNIFLNGAKKHKNSTDEKEFKSILSSIT